MTEDTEAVIKRVNVGGQSDRYAVEFGENIHRGHNCNGSCADGRGYFIPRAAFDLINPPAEDTPPEPTNNTQFKVGDVVLHKFYTGYMEDPFAGTVIRIEDTAVWAQMHVVKYGMLDEDGNVVLDDAHYCDTSANAFLYKRLPADKLVLARRDDKDVVKDRFTGEDINGEVKQVSDGSVWDCDLQMGFPVYIDAQHYDEQVFTCPNCGRVHLLAYASPTDVINADGDTETWCYDCVSRNASRCECCGRWFLSHDFTTVHTDSDDADCTEEWCSDCVDEHATYCERCHTYHSDNCDCPNCADIGRINGYSFKPSPQFKHMEGEVVNSSTLYYGVEDETEGSGYEPERFARMLGETTEEVYCKHDGSLNNGAEVVTHPCTLRYHLESDMWERVAEAGKMYNMKSHDTTTCGLHVHISRKAFEGVEDYEEKLTLAYDRFRGYWKAISRRRDGVSRWSAFLSEKRGEKTNTKVSEVKMKKDRHDRYQAVNLCNSNTVEIRIFRGTLKVSTIKATLWLVDACNRFIINGGDVETCKFSDLIDLKNAPDFVKEYLTAREIPIV